MRIVVSGGAGAMAWSGVIYLLEQPDVTEILLADLSEAKVKERIGKLGGDKRLKGQALDLMDIAASARAFTGYDVVYNCALLTTCTAATQAALEAGAKLSGPWGLAETETACAQR